MPIEVACACGRTFKVKDEHAGRRVKCPACGSVLDIPMPTSEPSPSPAGLNLNDLHEGLHEDRMGVDREASLTDVWNVLVAISNKLGDLSSASPVGPGRQREYKVITQKDKWFSGKFDPEKVEGALNSYAKQGWSLKGVATASVPGFGGQRDELVIVMER